MVAVMPRNDRFGRRGIALIIALFTLLFMSLLTVLFLDITGIDQQITTNYVRTMQADFLADAGIETAVYELTEDAAYNGTGGEVEFPAGSGNTYNVSISGNTITSVGTAKGFSSTLEADFTIGSDNTVTLDNWRFAQ